jgi:hypothetical protein
MKTFQEWLKIKEGLWVSDSAAEQTTGGVRAKRKSKDAAPASAGQTPGQSPMGMGGGMSMPPK